MRKHLPLIIVLSVLTSIPAFAQLELGASYELRNEDPNSGFGVRVEKGFLEKIPVVNLGLRAHFSYFSDENKVSESGITYSADITNYDFGLALIGGLNVGLVEPYVGIGLGSETIDLQPKDFEGVSVEDENDSSIYWNGLIGAKVTIIPILKPFIEYRYSDTSIGEPSMDQFKDQTGRIIFGVSLSF